MTINVNDTEFPYHINNCSVMTFIPYWGMQYAFPALTGITELELYKTHLPISCFSFLLSVDLPLYYSFNFYLYLGIAD